MADPGFRPGGGVTTVGTGRVPVVPDMVLVRLAAESTDPDAAQAHRSAAAAATALADALAGAGVRSRDIRTTTTSSWTVPGDTVTDGGSAVSRLPRTTVRLGVEARLRDVAGAGDVIGVALEAGAGAVHLEGTSLLVDDTGPAVEQARAAAFAEATAAAQQLAALAGRPLGRVVDVREPGAGAGPGGAGGPERMMRIAAATVPIEAGEQEVVVQLVVRFGWDDRFERAATSG